MNNAAIASTPNTNNPTPVVGQLIQYGYNSRTNINAVVTAIDLEVEHFIEVADAATNERRWIDTCTIKYYGPVGA